MITAAQYKVLTNMAVGGIVVRVRNGQWYWPEWAAEGTIAKLAQLEALTSRIEGELGDYTIVFQQTTKAPALIREYEEKSKAERKIRGR